MRKSRWIGAATMIVVAATANWPRSHAGKGSLLDDFGGVGPTEIEFDPWDWPDPPLDDFPEPEPPLPIPDFPDDDPFDGIPLPEPPAFDDDFPMDFPPDAKATQKAKKPQSAKRVRFLVFRAKSKSLGYGYRPILRALWAPFRWEVTTGLPNAKHVSGVGTEATFGTEFVTAESVSPPLSMMASRTASGLDVKGFDDQGNVVGPTSFPGAAAVDLAVEADATHVVFYARAQGATDYVKVGELAFSQTQPLYPTLSAYAIEKEAYVGFDRWRVTSSAKAPGTLTPAGEALELVYEAFDWHLDELHRIDAAADLTNVRAGVAGSIDFLVQASALVKGGMRSKINAAKSTSATTLKLIDKYKGGARSSIVAYLKKALKADLAARKVLAGK